MTNNQEEVLALQEMGYDENTPEVRSTRSLTFSKSFTPSDSGKHYLILRKAQRYVPGEISGTITQ